MNEEAPLFRAGRMSLIQNIEKWMNNGVKHSVNHQELDHLSNFRISKDVPVHHIGWRMDSKIWVVSLQLAILLLSILAVSMNDQATIDPIYLDGDQVTVKVYPSGSFIVDPVDFPSRTYDNPSSYWSFKVDDEVVNTNDPLITDHIVTPVRMGADGNIRVRYIVTENVLIDVTYQEAGPSCLIAVTFIDLDNSNHDVSVRYLYDLQEKVISPAGEPPVTYEMSYSAPAFDNIDIFEKDQKKGEMTLGVNNGASHPSKVVFENYYDTLDTAWSYKVNQSKQLGEDPTILLYWEGMDLPPGGSTSIRHFFGKDGPVLVERTDDLSIESMTVDPVDTFVGMTRTIEAVGKNSGSETVVVDLDFIVTDDNGHYIANGSMKRAIPPMSTAKATWNYKVRKVAETRAIVVIDPHNDVYADDNLKMSDIVAHTSPYRIKLTFEDGSRIEYSSMDSGQEIGSTFIVKNIGTSEDTIIFSTSSLPDGWNRGFNRTKVQLKPGASTLVEVTLSTTKDNDYYNYAVDVIGRSEGGNKEDKILLFISFSDIIDKGGGNSSINGNITPVYPNPNPKPITNVTNNPTTTPRNADPKDPVIVGDGGPILTVMIVIIVVLIGIVAVHQIMVLGSKMSMKGILEDLYKNLYKSGTSDAYRKAIFKAYERMCKEMAKVGQERGRHLTPKEFEKQLREYLPIDKKNLHTLTNLFEEARYSDHSFNEKKKERALGALRGIIESLDDVTTFEEVKEKRWFGKNT